MAEENQIKAEGAGKYLQPYKSKRQIMFDNFLGGLFWSLGTFVGLTILVGISGYFISKIDLIPIIGGWMSQIVQETVNNTPAPQLPLR